MKVCVLGLELVGSVTAAALAHAGHRVIGVDACQARVDLMNSGDAPNAEPGLGSALAEIVGSGRLSATTDEASALRTSEIALICLPVPTGPDGEPDVRAVEQIGERIGRALADMDRPFAVVLRSAVPPGTTDQVLRPALARGSRGNPRVKVATNPEFLREGTALYDFHNPPFILVGCDDLGTAAVLHELYADLKAPFIETSVRTSEAVKYGSSAYRALKMCFANEVGALCDAIGVDGREVMRILAMDRKLSVPEGYMQLGFAFGGPAWTQDTPRLVDAARSHQLNLPLLAAIKPSNDNQIRAAADAVIRTGKGRVGVVGLVYSPAAGNLRDRPVVRLVEALLAKGVDVRVLDRQVSTSETGSHHRPDVAAEIPHLLPLFCDDVEAFVDYAEVLVVGSPTADATRALGLVGPECDVVDLTGGVVFDCRRDRLAERRCRSRAGAAL